MKRVYKYPLDIQDEVVVMMPKGARVLSVQVQNGRPCLWAAVDPSEQTLEERLFRIAGTGHPKKAKQLWNRTTFELFPQNGIAA